MATLRKIPVRLCDQCRKIARVELKDKCEHSLGFFCRSCGKARLKTLTMRERGQSTLADEYGVNTDGVIATGNHQLRRRN